MDAFRTNLEKTTRQNTYYRKVLFTTRTMQLVVMSLVPGQEIGMERHPKTTQFIRIEAGRARAQVGKRRYTLKNGDMLMIPPGAVHNIWNASRRHVKLYTLYSPPEHAHGTKEKKKMD